MKDPAFLFYSSDFLTGVADLTMEERGQYITLMCLQHQKGHLSDKTIRLALGYDLVKQKGDVLSKFIVDENGFYYNQRLEQEILKREKVAEIHRASGKLHIKLSESGTTKRISKRISKRVTISEDVNENINEDVIKDINATINDFILFRKQINKPMTDRAIKLFHTELNKLASDDDTKIKIVNQSILRGWTSVFPLSKDKTNKPVNMGNFKQSVYDDEILRQLDGGSI